MWRKERKQMSMADAMVGRRKGQNERLERIGGLLNWGRSEQMLGAVYAASEGRPANRPLVMLPALVLQQGYSLSDPELEEALCDRLSFRRFVGLSLEEEVPHHSRLSRYRTHLAQRGLADELICGDEQTVYADKAYDSKARRELLARMGIGDGIMRRARWGTARQPDPQLVARNLSLSPIRSAVERSFAAMKQWYGYRRVRYRGLARNALQLHMMCIAINLRRALVLGDG